MPDRSATEAVLNVMARDARTSRVDLYAGIRVVALDALRRPAWGVDVEAAESLF